MKRKKKSDEFFFFYIIVFTDLSVDKVNEEDILKVLKYLNKVYDMPPVVVLSTNVFNNVRETCLKRGFDEYIVKPIDIKGLDRIINLFFKP